MILRFRKIATARCLLARLSLGIGILSALSSVAAGAGEGALTLPDAIGRAKARNPERAVIQAEREATLAQSRRALAPAAPTFGVTFNNMASPFSLGNSAGQVYQVAQTLGFPGKAIVESKSLGLDAGSLEQDLHGRDLEIERSVKVAFYRLWLSRRKLDLNELKRASFEKILKIAQRRAVKGTTAEVDSLVTKFSLHAVANERSDLVSDERASRATLNVLMGEGPDSLLDLQEPQAPLVPFQSDAAQVRKKLIAENLALKSAGVKVEAAGSRLTGAKLGPLPDFTLTAGVDNLNNYSTQIQLAVPLFFWWGDRENIKGASQIRTAREAEVESLRRSLLESTEDRLALLVAQGEKLANYRKNLMPISERAFQVALANYGFGKVDFPTLVGSANTFVNSKIEYEALLTDYSGRIAELEESLGGSLP